MRILLRSLLILLSVFIIVLLTGWWYLQHYLSTLPIQQLSYNISSISLRQLTLSKLQFRLPQQQLLLETELQQLQINWQWQALKPTLTSVHLQQASIHIKPESVSTTENIAAATPGKPATAFSLPASWQLPDILPQHIRLDAIQLILPCQQQQCYYHAVASLQQITPQQWQLLIQASAGDTLHDTQQLQLNASYLLAEHLPQIHAEITLGNSLLFQLNNLLKADHGLWLSGDTQLTLSPPENWLQQQAAHWGYPLPPNWLQQFTKPVQLTADWQWRLAENKTGPATLEAIAEQLTGQLQLTGSLPSALAIPDIGWLKGQLHAEVKAENGQLTAYTLQADALLTELAIPSALRQSGIATEQLKISLHSTDNTLPRPEALPLTLTLESSAPAVATLTAQLLLNAAPPYSVMIQQGQLALHDLAFSPAAGLSLQHLNAKTDVKGFWQHNYWQLVFSPDTALSSQLAYEQLTTEKLRLQFPLLTLEGGEDFSQLRFNSELQLTAEQLTYPQLKRLNWQWQAKAGGNLQQATLSGTLSNGAGAQLEHQLNWQDSNGALNWQLADIFLLAGNPLAATTTAWPELLEISRGRFSANGNVAFNNNGLISSTNYLNASELSGIYDRSLFKGLSGQLQADYKPHQLHLSTDNLILDEINHGIVAGPLKLAASYQTSPDNLTAGKLDLQQLSLLLMGGSITTEPQQLDLSKDNQLLHIKVNQLELAKLLQQHPSSELSGTGRISGSIPIGITSEGISVEQGYVAAETPGGQLQYRSPGSAGMAASNPGMKVILDALDDFHYSILSSNVSYDTSGKLMLALRLEGLNPALEQGRAINFNINLEEDLPAMITSLQLSSQISDKIKQRVQQRLQQREAGSSSGENR
ncbi:YdbH domain-containing protein [Chromatiaceae bacterium AAb-1]|nr:YdbH domain-containing protein [Chromatiaceae bacterium AAb-1]